MDATRKVTEWDEDAFERALSQASRGKIQAAGVSLSAQDLGRLLAAAPRDPDDPEKARLESVDFRGTVFRESTYWGGATFSGMADFSEATFGRTADFSEGTFSGTADFTEATFNGAVWFAGASFSGEANFSGRPFSGGATFSHTADFSRATFSGPARFRKATFGGTADFSGATTFGGRADFDEATFSGIANFGGATFSGDTYFGGATFSRDTYFDGATFSRDTLFVGVTFSGRADFDDATFSGNANLGPILVCSGLWLDGAIFARRAKIVASALRTSFVGTEFRRGADIRLRWAEVWLRDTDFAEESLLTSLSSRQTPARGEEESLLGFEMPTDSGAWCCPRSREPPPHPEPHLLTLAGSRVARLTLSRTDLKECLFAGAHGLDDLQLDRVEFARPPEGWRPIRWTRRETIADEHHWHASTSKASGWNQARTPARAEEDAPWPPEPPAELQPTQLASLYRQLRKSREDRKDEPGANDFYYGEMEMRRRGGPRAERVILWAYWLFAGYGLRASRALLALVITIIVGAIPLALWGFCPRPSYGRAVLFALQSSISLLRSAIPPAHETAGGQVIEIILRLAGPLFFGLALVALRGRVKR